MRRTALTATLLLLVPLAAGQSSLEVAFHPPAQAGPDVTVLDAAWALIVFDDGAGGDFAVQFPRSMQERAVTLYGVFDHDLTPAMVGPAMTVPVESSKDHAPLAATAAFDQGIGSLYLQGAIRIAVRASEADIRPSGTCLDELVPEVQFNDYAARYDELCPPDAGVALVAKPTAATLAVEVDAAGLDTIEWHHARIDCGGAQTCPGGGAREDYSASYGQMRVTNTVQGFHRLTSADARAQGAGSAAMVILGGPNLDVQAQGWMRLPLASGSAACATCVALADQSLRVEGNVTLSGLRLAPDGRLQAGLGGDLHAVRVDEQGIDPATLMGWSVAVLSAGALVAGGLMLAAKALAALFTRNAAKDVRNPRTRQALQAIEANPGIHLRGLSRLLGWGVTVTRRHATRLRLGGHVVARRDGKTIRFFENHGRYGPEWKAHALLREEPLRLLHDWVARHPDAMRSDAVRHAGVAWGWSRRTAYDRLARLEGAGLLSAKARRLIAFAVASPVAQTPEAAPEEFLCDSTWEQRGAGGLENRSN